MVNSLTPAVFVVDSDLSIRKSLEHLIWKAGLQPKAFASASDFLAFPKLKVPSCLITELALPDLNGLELQTLTVAERSDMQVIFLTEQADIPSTVRAIKRGAFEFLIKPYDSESLLKTIRQAINRSELIMSREVEYRSLQGGFESLTPREREVMTLVASGFLNKQVGEELGISEVTVKAHRGSVMRKMRADSLAHLVNMASRLRVVRQFATNAA